MAYVGHNTQVSVEIMSEGNEVRFRYDGGSSCDVYLTTSDDQRGTFQASKQNIEQFILGLQAIAAVME